MSQIHFLNVSNGDCTIIQHNAGGTSVIDVCNGNAVLLPPMLESSLKRSQLPKQGGNYRMCERPTNPLAYLNNLGIHSVFRFILTHPDMDHLDGFDELMRQCAPINFWDSGIRRMKPDFTQGRYLEKDWRRYNSVIQGEEPVKVVTPKAGARFKYANLDENGVAGSDGLYILAPDSNLVEDANKDQTDLNDASYVILYRSQGGRVIIPGDAHDNTWDYVLKNHQGDVANCSVLIAPHHGRKSDRQFDFLDVLKPQLTLFGCAPSEHLAYDAWNTRKLPFITNNQAGNIILDCSPEGITVHVQNATYAADCGADTASQGYPILRNLRAVP